MTMCLINRCRSQNLSTWKQIKIIWLKMRTQKMLRKITTKIKFSKTKLEKLMSRRHLFPNLRIQDWTHPEVTKYQPLLTTLTVFQDQISKTPDPVFIWKKTRISMMLTMGSKITLKISLTFLETYFSEKIISEVNLYGFHWRKIKKFV